GSRGGKATSVACADGGRTVASVSGESPCALLWDAGKLVPPVEATAKPAAKPEALWADLGGDDPAKAEQAVRALAAAPERAVPFLVKKFPPHPRTDRERIARLTRQLDDEDFEEREQA